MVTHINWFVGNPLLFGLVGCGLWVSVTRWSSSPSITFVSFSVSFSGRDLQGCRGTVGHPRLPNTMLGSGVVTAVITWFTLMVYNYSQINYLQQTVLLYKEAAKNLGFSAEHYKTVPCLCKFNLSFSVLSLLLCLFLVFALTPSIPPCTCSVMLLPIEGGALSLTLSPFIRTVFGMINVHSPTGWRGQPASSMSH